nr:MAG TPA: hypothetical protein [Caudoviricetes sp.]
MLLPSILDLPSLGISMYYVYLVYTRHEISYYYNPTIHRLFLQDYIEIFYHYTYSLY